MRAWILILEMSIAILLLIGSFLLAFKQKSEKIYLINFDELRERVYKNQNICLGYIVYAKVISFCNNIENKTWCSSDASKYYQYIYSGNDSYCPVVLIIGVK